MAVAITHFIKWGTERCLTPAFPNSVITDCCLPCHSNSTPRSLTMLKPFRITKSLQGQPSACSVSTGIFQDLHSQNHSLPEYSMCWNVNWSDILQRKATVIRPNQLPRGGLKTPTLNCPFPLVQPTSSKNKERNQVNIFNCSLKTWGLTWWTLSRCWPNTCVSGTRQGIRYRLWKQCLT